MIKWREHPEMVEFMMEYIPGHQEPEIRAEFEKQFGIVLTEGQIGNFKYLHGVKSGTHGGRFQKGHITHNKGKKMPKEVYEKAKGTMFRKGHIPENHKEVGSERINVDGYTEVKVAEPNRWRLKQRVVYEEYYGIKLSNNDAIIFLDGNKQNFRISNLVKMTRAELCRYNQDHLSSDDVQINETAILIAKLRAKTGEKKRGGKTE